QGAHKFNIGPSTVNVLSGYNFNADDGTLYVNGTTNQVGILTSSIATNYHLQVGDGTGNLAINLAPSATGTVGIHFDNAGGVNGIEFDNTNDELYLNGNGGWLM